MFAVCVFVDTPARDGSRGATAAQKPHELTCDQNAGFDDGSDGCVVVMEGTPVFTTDETVDDAYRFMYCSWDEYASGL